MKKSFKFTALICLAAILFTGCGGGTEWVPEPDKEPATNPQNMTSYGATVSVQDIKDAYDYDDSKDIMPLYNVDPTEAFEFNFNFDAYETDIDLYDFVSIHTDSACEEASEIYYTAELAVDNGKTTLTVAPMAPVLATDSQDKDYVYNDVDSWGNAPMYYIALHYDLEADTPTKLTEPTIIPFTVKKEISAPTISGNVSVDGRFSLSWEPVENAEKYIVYNLIDSSLYTGEDNHAINGSKTGYDCGVNATEETQLYLLKEGETTECVYDGFSGPTSHSLAEVEDMITGKKSNSGQNYGVKGEYFVTAVIDGKESSLSNAVSTANLTLPYEVKRESEIEGRYPTPADFPAEVEVINVDGTSSMHKVNYERVHVDCFEYSWDEYDYTIEGTYIYGSVGFDEDSGEAPANDGVNGETGNVSPTDQVDKTPDEDVSTIIPADENKDYDDSLIDAQNDNTRDHIENGNTDTVVNVPEGIYINADTAEEEWLALNMVQGNTEISVEAFPSLQDPYTLVDVFYKVYYQNPYVMGIKSFSYDYNALTFTVNYVYDQDTISSKQEEIAKKAKEIVESCITADMDSETKVNVLYNYLVNNSVYDNEALEDAEKNNFVKGEGTEFEDAFNSYGILVKGKGVCMSYAYCFRLLCDLGGVECIVVTGYLDGNLPHAWNMVNLNGEWYEIDCTNNAVNTGIPYFLYQADTSLAITSGYTKDDMYAIDYDLSQFDGNDETLEYYRNNGLFAENLEEYKDIIIKNISKDSKVFAVRWSGNATREEFDKTIILAYNELGLEDLLESLRYGVTGGFVVIINE